MANELRIATSERNGGYIFDRVIIEDRSSTRQYWNNNTSAWVTFAGSYAADSDVDLTSQSINGETYYAANVPSGISGNRDLTLLFFEQGDALADGGWDAEGSLAWDGDADSQITLAGLQTEVDAGGAVVPLAATLTEFVVPQVNLELAQGETRTFQITFTGSTGNPTSFQGDTITCVLSTIRGTTALAEVSCTVLTTDYNVVSIPFTGSHTATAGMFRHTLWNETDDQRLAYGAVPIARTVGYST